MTGEGDKGWTSHGASFHLPEGRQRVGAQGGGQAEAAEGKQGGGSKAGEPNRVERPSVAKCPFANCCTGGLVIFPGGAWVRTGVAQVGIWARPRLGRCQARVTAGQEARMRGKELEMFAWSRPILSVASPLGREGVRAGGVSGQHRQCKRFAPPRPWGSGGGLPQFQEPLRGLSRGKRDRQGHRGLGPGSLRPRAGSQALPAALAGYTINRKFRKYRSV